MSFNIPDNTNPTQYHWVVSYDCKTGEFSLDYDTTSAVFPNGSVFEPETNEWRPLHEHEWEEDKTLYNIAGDALYREIENNLNERW